MPPIVELTNFSLSAGSTPLLDSVDAQVVPGQRVALAGPNGCGKSTLLRAIFSSDGGSERGEYYTVGAGGVRRAPQFRESAVLAEQDDLRWSRLLGGGDEEELRSLPLPDAIDLAAAENSDLLDDADSWRRLSVAADAALHWSAAGYDETPLGELSPGCAVRAYLALALHRPGIELLLLDEPTNHLDIPSVLWLQKTILSSTKSVVVVSHDAAFLDAVCDHLWVVDKEKKSLTVSGACYSDYRRAERLARDQQAAAYDAQQKRHKRLTGVADRLRDHSARGEKHAAKDRDKLQRDFKRDRAGRSGKKAKAIETLRDKEEAVERVSRRVPLRIEIEPLGAGTDSSIILGDVRMGYSPEDPLPLPPISLRVDFGDRVAIVGFNGAGKSTILKTVTGRIAPLSGDVSVGRELRIGNLMQEHESLPRDVTPREHFAALVGVAQFDAGARLIKYGLSRWQVDCPMGELNPGARARAILAGFSMRSVNALILDEITNHLDEEAIEEVVAALNEFEGTLVMVSHHRDFLDSVRLTRTIRLGADGLREVESMDEFVFEIEDAVDRVVARSWQ